MSGLRPARFALLSALLVLLVLTAQRSTPAQDGEGEKPAPETYGETPDDLVPFRREGEPYHRYFTEQVNFRGPGRDAPEPDVDEVRIGILLPMKGSEAHRGQRVRNGVTLAIEDANRKGGGFKPDVPFKAVYRDEAQAWGAAANAAVEFAFDHHVWGMIGALDDENSHVMTRVLLKIEVPVVNTGGTDPTLTEHMIPWMIRTRCDDRRASYALARRIFEKEGHQRVAVFRANDRYARVGIAEFVDAARRMHHPIVLEVRYGAQDKDFAARIERIKAARPDAVVMWGSAEPTGRALAALRKAGVKVPVYGPDRLADPAFRKAAGDAAEGVVFTHPFSPKKVGAPYAEFARRFRARFQTEPDSVAALAYDGTRHMIAAIRKAGLNRVLIRDQLFAQPRLSGVCGDVVLDPTGNNVAPVALGRIEKGKLVYD